MNKEFRNFVNQVLLQEAGDRGFAYEATLINALEAGGVTVTPAADVPEDVGRHGINLSSRSKV